MSRRQDKPHTNYKIKSTTMQTLNQQLNEMRRREYNDDHLSQEERVELVNRVRQEEPDLLVMSDGSYENDFLELLD